MTMSSSCLSINQFVKKTKLCQFSSVQFSNIPFTRGGIHGAHMKHTWNTRRTWTFAIYTVIKPALRLHDVCFVYDSSCKRGITLLCTRLNAPASVQTSRGKDSSGSGSNLWRSFEGGAADALPFLPVKRAAARPRLRQGRTAGWGCHCRLRRAARTSTTSSTTEPTHLTSARVTCIDDQQCLVHRGNGKTFDLRSRGRGFHSGSRRYQMFTTNGGSRGRVDVRPPPPLSPYA